METGYGLSTTYEIKMLDAIEELDASHPIDLIPNFWAPTPELPESKNKSAPSSPEGSPI